jgi:hypothetical protein
VNKKKLVLVGSYVGSHALGVVLAMTSPISLMGVSTEGVSLRQHFLSLESH